MTETDLLASVGAVVSVGAWVAAYLVTVVLTRPVRPEPAPSAMDIGPESPAVAALLAGGWTLTEDAAEATRGGRPDSLSGCAPG